MCQGECYSFHGTRRDIIRVMVENHTQRALGQKMEIITKDNIRTDQLMGLRAFAK